MKKKVASILLIFTMLFSSVIPGFAASKLSRPEIEEIEAGKQSIKIDWNYIKHADEYKVYRATSSDGTYKYIGSADESWYRDYDITKGKRYYYKVKAISYGDYNSSSMSKWRSGKVAKPVSSSKSTSQTVYITDTGSKYHRAGCQYLWNSSHAISLSTAKSYGYTACSRCW